MRRCADDDLSLRLAAVAIRLRLVAARVPPGSAGPGRSPLGTRGPVLVGASGRRRGLDPGLGGSRAGSGSRADDRVVDLAHRLVVERRARSPARTTAPRPQCRLVARFRKPAVGWLRDLRREWIEVLDRTTDTDLDAVAPFPWHNGESGRSVAHMLGWVNAELMKNAAEIGQLRMMRAAGTL